jgi:RNA polymerase sigma factor (sigma-70 family)
MTEQEKTLIAGCAKGEKAAWDTFVREFSSLVYHAIKKTFNLYHSNSRSDAVEELYQEVFVSLLRDDCKKLRQFRGDRGCSLASWLRVVASRQTIDFLRRQPPPSGEIPDGLARNDPDLSESLIDEEQERLLNQAIQTLPPRDRILIDLVYRQSLPPEEIAAILKISVNAVYTQKSRILARLREALKTEL